VHYLADGLQVRALRDASGNGVFATYPIVAGSLLATWGGRIITYAALAALSETERRYAVQVEDGLHLQTIPAEVGLADFINHSCDPNAGLSGPISLVALRDIAADEEIRYDYAMSDCSPDLFFTCHCATSQCRGTIAPDDWMRPDLQARYRGYFSPYLQRRLDRLASARKTCL
jgi:hypothetical protein